MPKLTASLATLPNVEESIDLETIEFRMHTLNRAFDVIDDLFRDYGMVGLDGELMAAVFSVMSDHLKSTRAMMEAKIEEELHPAAAQ